MAGLRGYGPSNLWTCGHFKRRLDKNTSFENIYIYIYIEMGSSYTWCNLKKVTPFIDHRFVIDLMVKKIALNAN